MNEEKEIIEEIDDQSLSLIEDSPEESSEILYEDTSKRSENVKHFRMKNGTYMAAVYDKPVHTMDKSTGKFVDIVHRFEAKEDCYEAETNHFKVRFPKKEGKRKYVTVEKGERSVSWRYIPTIDSHKKRAEAAVHEHRRTSLAELPQFPKLTYEKTEAQTDLEYGISEKGVKENIILTKRPKSNIFRFDLKLMGLKAMLAEDKQSIRLYADDADGGEPELVIPPINMTDEAGVYSEAAHYELTEDETGTVMAIIIDPDWLFAEERLYPVTVDPQVLANTSDAATYVDHQKNGSFDVGRAGNGSVNLFTGTLSFTHNDITASGGKLPLTLSHTYHSNYSEMGLTDTTYGKGWFLSATQTLTLSTSSDIVATYRDAQGRKHSFKKDSDNVYRDTSGLGLIFNGTNVITDEKNNSMTFTGGKLAKISTISGTSMTFTYANNLLSKITDGIGRTATLTYTSGKLTKITDMKGRTTTFTYSGNNLTEITHPDTTKSAFAYDSAGKMTRVTDHTGIYYDVAYDSNNTTHVASITRKGTKKVAHNGVTTVSATDGGGLTFSYRNASTVVKDQWTNICNVYCLDDYGRMIYSYEDIASNDSLTKGEITVTDLSEYGVVLNHKTGTATNGRYTQVKAAIAGTATMHPNYLTNGSFGTGSASGWTVSGGGSVVSESYLSGYKSYRFSGTYATQYLQQTASINATNMRGNVLVASAWANASNPTGTFKLYAKLTCADGSVVERETWFDMDCKNSWQYVAIPLAIPVETKASSVLVKFDYSQNNGTCLVSNLRLTETRGTYTLQRDSLGTAEKVAKTVLGTQQQYVRAVYQTNGLQSTMTYYNASSDAIETVTRDEENNPFYSYAIYDTSHRPIKTMDYRGLVTEYTYDSFDNIKTQKTYHKDDTTKYLACKSDYSSTTGRLLRAYDSRSNEISTGYTYDTQSDLLTRRTDPNGQFFTYSYNDRNDRQTAITALNADCCCCDVTNGFIYDANYLTQVTHNGFAFDFEYDPLGRNSKIKAGGSELVNFTYQVGKNPSVTSKYSNGYTSVVTSDSHGNPVSKTIGSTPVSTAEYDEAGNAKKLVDKLRKVCYTYTYDKDGNLTRLEERTEDGSTVQNYRSYIYDSGMRPTSSFDSRYSATYKPVYEKYGGRCYPDNATLGIEYTGKYTDVIERDKLRRTSARKLTLAGGSSPLMTDTYGYLQQSGRETTFVKTLTHKVNSSTVSTLTYTYDRMGNIETVADSGGTLVKYTYDGLNRLIQEDNYKASRRFVYTYDRGGNITSKMAYILQNGSVSALSKSNTYAYTAGWKDKLSVYNGTTINYDFLGNPTLYKGNTLTWTNVRRLASYKIGNTTNTFKYGADGIRYQKNSTTYTLDGSKIIRETDGNKTLVYYYGANGVVGFNYNGTNYYYQKNLQGDVTAIYNASGTCVVTYTYDAWGNVLSVGGSSASTIGTINPFRYRSYYYDTETNLYYLETRYYDPEVGRFINSDAYEYLGNGAELRNYNLFAYCGNNPIEGYDPEGTWNWGGVIAGLGIVAATVITVATFGIASPVGAVVAAAAISTGVTIAYAAATDQTAVLDLSFSVTDGTEYRSIGGSLVIDFDNGWIEFYGHSGFGAGRNSGLSYSTGIVKNYNGNGSYGGPFVQAGGAYYFGVNHCYDPTTDYSQAVKATSLTFGSGLSYNAGFDMYYDPIVINKGD